MTIAVDALLEGKCRNSDNTLKTVGGIFFNNMKKFLEDELPMQVADIF